MPGETINCRYAPGKNAKEREKNGMNKFLSEWSQDVNSIPVGPLAVIPMDGCEEMGDKVNAWLTKWHSLQESQDEQFYTMPGENRDSFLITPYCPRFGTGEGKGMIKDTVRGYDL